MTTSNVSDAEIEAAFRGTDFGTVQFRKLLEGSVFKKAVGYHCGHTITTIMKELGLIGTGKSELPTKKGRAFLAHAFADLMIHSG